MSKGFHFSFALLIAAGVLSLFCTRAAGPRENSKAQDAGLHQDFGIEQALNASLADESPRPQSASLQNLGVNRLCFLRDGAIYVQDVGANEARRIIKGLHPDLSPTGDKVAFTHYPDESLTGRIKILSLDNGRTDELTSIAGFDSHSPRWSGDGNKIAFSVRVNKRWEIGLLDPATGEWRVVTDKLADGDLGFFFDSWAADNKSIVCHDMDYVYEVALDGSLLRRIGIKTIIDGYDISSSSEFSFSRDQKFLLFNSAPGHDENAVVFVFDLARRKLMQITPKEMDSYDPQWLPSGEEIIFSSREEKENHQETYNVYKISLDRTGLTTVVEDARDASYALR